MCNVGLLKVKMDAISRDALAAAGVLRYIHPLRAPELTIPEQVTEHPSGPHSRANVSFNPQRLGITGKLRRTVKSQRFQRNLSDT